MAADVAHRQVAVEPRGLSPALPVIVSGNRCCRSWVSGKLFGVPGGLLAVLGHLAGM
jgi:hypothetical protein